MNGPTLALTYFAGLALTSGLVRRIMASDERYQSRAHLVLYSAAALAWPVYWCCLLVYWLTHIQETLTGFREGWQRSQRERE